MQKNIKKIISERADGISSNKNKNFWTLEIYLYYHIIVQENNIAPIEIILFYLIYYAVMDVMLREKFELGLTIYLHKL